MHLVTVHWKYEEVRKITQNIDKYKVQNTTQESKFMVVDDSYVNYCLSI
jgi:hypothetical protein